MSSKASSSKKIIVSYTRALFNIALEGETLEKCIKELSVICEVMRNNPRILKILTAPVIVSKKKEELIVQLCMDNHISQIVQNFLQILSANHRFSYLPAIEKHFELAFSEHKGKKNIEVITAVALNETESKAIKTKLEKLYKCDLHITETVDIKIIGGVIVSDGTKMYDGSVKNKLKRLEALSKREIYTI